MDMGNGNGGQSSDVNSRGAVVLTGFMQGHRAEVWGSNSDAAQNGHAGQRQACLAHLLRDTQYVIDQGDKRFAPQFKELLKRSIEVGHRRERLTDGTLKRHQQEFERELDRVSKKKLTSEAGQKFAKSFRRCRTALFVFVTRRDVPPTNNFSERELRPSVIFPKVTGPSARNEVQSFAPIWYRSLQLASSQAKPAWSPSLKS
jgi:transposase